MVSLQAAGHEYGDITKRKVKSKLYERRKEIDRLNVETPRLANSHRISQNQTSRAARQLTLALRQANTRHPPISD
jgi:hypothetical protein